MLSLAKQEAQLLQLEATEPAEAYSKMHHLVCGYCKLKALGDSQVLKEP